MERRILLALAAFVALAAIVTVAVVGRDWVSDLFGDKHGAPTLMIVSRRSLQSSAEANLTVSYDQKAQALAAIGAGKDTKAAAPAKDAGSKPASQEPDAGRQRALGFQVLLQSMEDPLGGRIGEDFSNSGRFRLIAHAKVVDAMDAYAKDNHIAPANLIQAGAASVSKGGVTQSSAKEKTTIASQGITSVASKVGADYTLVVSIGEPGLQVDGVPGTNGQPGRVVFSAQPTINCQIFETHGRAAYQTTMLLDHPVVQSVAAINGTPIQGELVAAYNRITVQISERASQQVLAWALDKIAPAKIMQVSKAVVINRGTNDGVVPGAVYAVERETGEAVREGGDNGVDLGKVRVPIGSIVVKSAQDRISTVDTASGGPFQKGDIVKVVAASRGAGSAASGGSSTTSTDADPLGSRAIAEAGAAKQAGVKVHKVNLAVDHINVVSGGRSTDSPDVAQAVSAALASDPRIAILPRAELAKLGGERALNSRATGDFGLDPAEGLAASGYLVDGEFTVSSARHTSSITVAGVATQTGSSVSTTVIGVLRVTKMDGRLVQTVRFTAPGASPAAAADVGARALLLQLFPMSVVQVGPPGTIRVNRGQDAGLKVGARLQIYRRGQPIVDKQTGALLSEGARTLIGEAVVSDVEANISTAQVSGGVAVAEGDTAQVGAGAAAAAAAPAVARKPAAKHAPAAKPDSGSIHF